MTRRLNISDVWVDPVNMDQALARVTDFIEKGDKPHCIFAVNPEKNFSVPKDPLLYETFKRADLLIPDGIGVVLAARVLHGIKLSRVPGVELMDNICRLSARKGSVDEGIKGSRDLALKKAKNLCKSLGIKQHVFSFRKEIGKSLDQKVRESGLGKEEVCAFCGIARR